MNLFLSDVEELASPGHNLLVANGDSWRPAHDDPELLPPEVLCNDNLPLGLTVITFT